MDPRKQLWITKLCKSYTGVLLAILRISLYCLAPRRKKKLLSSRLPVAK